MSTATSTIPRPLHPHRPQRRPVRQAFTHDQLQAIFAPGAKFDSPLRYWAPILALYQGLRLVEIASLRPEDVALQPSGPVIRIVHHTGAKATYNRDLPVHPVVLDLGLDSLVWQAHMGNAPWLLPDHSPRPEARGDRISRWFVSTHLNTNVGIDDPALSFSSLRHTFARRGRDTCVNARADDVIRALLGYAPQRPWNDEPQPAFDELHEVLAAIRFPVNHAPYDPGSFSPFFGEHRSCASDL